MTRLHFISLKITNVSSTKTYQQWRTDKNIKCPILDKAIFPCLYWLWIRSKLLKWQYQSLSPQRCVHYFRNRALRWSVWISVTLWCHHKVVTKLHPPGPSIQTCAGFCFSVCFTSNLFFLSDWIDNTRVSQSEFRLTASFLLIGLNVSSCNLL